MRTLFPLCLTAVLLLAGCRPEPEMRTEPTFSFSNQTVVYRAPDAVEFAYTTGLPSEFSPLLYFSWTYPVPPTWQDTTVSEAVKEVCSQFQEQGPLIDKAAWLDTAQSDWADAQATGLEYFPYNITLDTTCSHETDRFWAFYTTVTTPDRYPNGGVSTQISQGSIFDSSTGAPMALWDLFTVPAEEVQARLVTEGAEYYDEKRLNDTFDPAFVSVWPEHLSVDYPAGTVINETSAGFSVKYAKLKDILQPWALP